MSEWIVPSNLDKFDSLLAFEELESIDWKQDNHNFEIGDVVYIYVSTCKAIRFRCKVTKTDLTKREIDDSKYGESEEYNKYSEFTLTKKYSGDCLSFSSLKENGINGNIQSAIRASDQLLGYIKSFDNINFVTFSPTSSIWLATALMTHQEQNSQIKSFKKGQIIEKAHQFSTKKITDEDFENCLGLTDIYEKNCFFKDSRRYRVLGVPDTVELKGDKTLYLSNEYLTIGAIIDEIKLLAQNISSSENTDVPFMINGKRVFIVFQGQNYDAEYQGDYIQAQNGPKNETNRDYHHWRRVTEVSEGDIIFNLASGFIKAISIAKGKYYQPASEPDKNRVNCEYHALYNPIDYKKLKEEIKTACKGFDGNCPFDKNGEGNKGYLYDSNKALTVLFSKEICISNQNLCKDLPFLNKILSEDGKSSDQIDDKSKSDKPTNSMQKELIQKYSDTLLKSKNIIFHGAPGTGKSFLAKQIAANIVSNGRTSDYTELSEEEKNQIGLVQFHPSYDYSDFVEGLRPKLNGDGSMGFDLKEGIFMEFVSKARKNYEDSQKSEDEIRKEQDADLLISTFFEGVDLGEGGTEFETKNGNRFFITDVDERHIYINIPGNETTNKLSLNINEVRKMLESGNGFTQIKDVTYFFNKKNATQKYSYDFVIYNEIKKTKATKAKKINRDALKNYVFIIDEINRGEISKIFGELFYSIDPGYRGKAGEISTQYANLHEDPEERFYIPDNVYIIGTMNDIDRSVDSFDFAMRRRFRFIELKADEMTGMLDSLSDETKKDAIDRMKKLNKAIAEDVEGLNENYQIGAAYFLKLKEIDANQLWTDYLEPLLKDYIQGMPNEKDTMDSFKKAYGYTESVEVNADANPEG